MKRRSQAISSLSGSPKRQLSQMSIHDFPNLELLSQKYEDEQLGIMLSESVIVSRFICRQIIQKASDIIQENYIMSLLIPFGCQWTEQFTNMIVQDITEDMNQIDSNSDEVEPKPCPIEHWRRMIGQIQIPKMIQIANRSFRRESQLQGAEDAKAEVQRFDTQPVKMGDLDDDIDFDTEIESMRQAKARQIYNLQQKQMQDLIKKQEYQEMNRQLKRLNVDSKSKYTYDFEGRVIVQKPPDVERYPRTYQDIQEKRVLLEVKDLFPHHKKQLESINNHKKKTIEQCNPSTLSNRFSTSQIDIIQLKQGVAFIEGKNEKRNDRQHSLIEIKDPKELQKTLSQIHLKMSKEEYSIITNQPLQSSFTTKQLNLTQNKVQLSQQVQSSNPQNVPLSINGDQSIQSLNSSILQKLNGTISIISDHYDELLIHDPSAFITPTTTKLPQIQQPFQQQQSVPQIPQHLLTEPTAHPLSNSVTKLPKTMYVPGTFSKIIPKYPRERISRIVKQIKY
ncbi:unnamed protein product (macronuclear) [Paramecium tetraurelia]|uniref:Uncharacterized protein n=1 Tax=Paramecium tetraurelia TaxID=5888 RepID=A0CKQ2_PARTE|nr:uncharacterized protein GSPATT00001083001 [Paramecium tetraurelia]CAK71369.1 unnamed protein product [Paramecium tetraurelia]|eukprot:XP_001438766.1 hypothetical protein (macronuclear) [Paramecium tetraurelia strain d4-2]